MELDNLDPATRASFELSGRHVDEQVLAGRNLDEVLAESQESPGGEFWFNHAHLKHFSNAVAAQL